MKMLPLGYWTTVFWAVFIAQGAVSGQAEKKVPGLLGGTVSFGPTNINPSVSSIIWKQKNSSGIVVKAIEWDDDGINIPNERFKGITALNNKTGEITIRDLNIKHAGLYTIDIDSKEQEQKFKLELFPEVPKPEIKIEKISVNPNAVYLICEYSETIIWKNSAGETLKGSPHSPKGQLITVEKGKPENYYTCTLENAVSRKTSEPVYERDLFKESQQGWIIVIVLVLILLLLLAGLIVMYKFCTPFHEFVFNHLGKKPCIGVVLGYLHSEKKENKNPEEGAASTKEPLYENKVDSHGENKNPEEGAASTNELLNAVKADSDGGSKDDKL